MNAERIDEKAVFNTARKITDSEARSSYIELACADNAEALERVLDLLRVHEEQQSFLESPPPGLDVTQGISPITEQPGDAIGPYKLLQQLGEGGMGVVYLAEQKEPVKRRVALKIIKPGMDTRQVITRFEAERQALAMMDHPNIAKVLDAGATESGRPYFVMELVNGLPVTKYCDEQHLTPKERLELFVPICEAVQHAHQKGIIHRDLKPSNILVAMYDNKAVPKIIDFGVAKATSHTLTDKTMFTQLGQIVGTLEYMSPEQAQRNQLDIDTRSDIYSLGVVLYELLTGETPFDRALLRVAAFDEMLRIIREEEPSKPSTKVSSSQSLPSIAANRRIEPGKLGSMMRGELDWIILKAMEKDRGRRYETASKFAEDVQHYLNDEAVVACPPSRGYRFRKFARRNRVLIATTVVVLLSIVTGVSVASWQAIRALQAEGLAQQRLTEVARERDRAVSAESRAKHSLEEALAAVDSMLTQVADEKLASVPFLDEVRRTLYEDALQIYRRLAFQDLGDPRLCLEAVRAQRRVGDILIDLGRLDEAEQELREAASRLAELLEVPPDAAAAEIELARVCGQQGRLNSLSIESRIEYLMQAVSILGRHTTGPAGDRDVELTLGVSLTALANLQDRGGDRRAGRATLERADHVLSELSQRYPADPEVVATRSKHLQNYGLHFLKGGELEAAEARYQQSVTFARTVVANNPNDTKSRHILASALLNQANVHLRQQKYASADVLYSESNAILEQLVKEHPSFPEYREGLAGSLMNACACASNLNDPDRAVALAERAVLVLDYLTDTWPTVRSYHGSLGGALSNLAWLLCAQERETGRAEELAQRAIREQRLSLEAVGGVNIFLMNHHLVLANIQMQLGHWAEAGATCETGLQIAKELQEKFPNNPLIPSTIEELQKVRDSARQRETQEIRRHALGPEHPDILQSMTHIVVCLGARGKHQEAEAMAANKKDTGEQFRFRAEAEELLGLDAKRRDELIADYFSDPPPNNAATVYWKDRGRWQYGSGEYEQSVADLTQAIEREAENGYYHQRRGAAYIALERWDEALTDLDEAIRIDSNDVWAHIRRSDAHRNLNHIAMLFRRARQYQRSIERRVENAQELKRDLNAWDCLEIGLGYHGLGDFAQAQRSLAQADILTAEDRALTEGSNYQKRHRELSELLAAKTVPGKQEQSRITQATLLEHDSEK